jgi:NitT/TauT family transport system substrate-binding protein
MRRFAVAVLIILATAVPSFAYMSIWFSLHWLPQAQFAGYYMAFEKGFYLNRDLDVFLIHGGPGKNPLVDLIEGKSEMATSFLSDGLIFRQNHKIVNIAQMVNRSNLMLMGWKSRIILSKEDIDGRKVSLWPDMFKSSYHAFFQQNHITPVAFPQYGSVALFLRKGVDACAAMEYNEYHQVLQSGVNPDKLTCFFMRDEGVGFPEDGIYCMESFWKENPQECRAFVEASLEGWRYARDHQEEALDMVMKYTRKAHVPTNRAHQRWMLTHLLESIFPDETGNWKTGKLSEDDYDRTVKIMEDQGQLLSAPPFETFHKGGIEQ